VYEKEELLKIFMKSCDKKGNAPHRLNENRAFQRSCTVRMRLDFSCFIGSVQNAKGLASADVTGVHAGDPHGRC
jgi:hypothetical protein